MKILNLNEKLVESFQRYEGEQVALTVRKGIQAGFTGKLILDIQGDEDTAPRYAVKTATQYITFYLSDVNKVYCDPQNTSKHLSIYI